MEKDPSTIQEVQAFVCTRTKDGKESCGAKGSAELRERLKKWTKTEGLSDRVKVIASLCLSHCEKGITVCIRPVDGPGQFFFRVDAEKDYENLQKQILAQLR